jgi:hypothetical protein
MNYASIYAMIIAGGAITYSTKVKADPFKIIAEAVAEAVKYVYNEVTENGYQMLWEEMTKTSENPQIAIGASTDSQNELSKSIFDRKMNRVNMPEPMPCKARTSSFSIGALTNGYSVAETSILEAQTKNDLVIRYNDVRYSQQPKELKDRYGKAWGVITAGYGALPGKRNLSDQNKIQMANDWIVTINGVSSRSNPSVLRALKNYTPLKRTQLMKGVVGHTSVSAANLIFTNALSKRIGKDGVSVLQECSNEINRTYGDRKGKYRAHVNAYAHPVPAMREALKLKSFNNYLKLLIMQEKERELFVKCILLANSLTSHYENKQSEASAI